MKTSAPGSPRRPEHYRNDIALLDRDTGRASQILDGASVGLRTDARLGRDNAATRWTALPTVSAPTPC